jgi:hypothetical protein
MSVTPDFVGQRYKDTNTGNIWIANSTTPGDWTLEVQNMQVKWEPHSSKLATLTAFVAYPNLSETECLSGITELSFEQSQLLFITIITAPDVQVIQASNLTDVIDCETDASYGIVIDDCGSLTSISFPLLAVCNGAIGIRFCSNLTSISLPSLVSMPNSEGYYGFQFQQNPLLETIDVSSYVPLNGASVNCEGCKLVAASVNQILAVHVANPAYVSGVINLSGGTTSAPTGQGITDKATLIGRGVQVLTN